MARRCKTCSHDEVKEINRLLRKVPRRPINMLAAQFSLSADALERHVIHHLDRDREPTWTTAEEIERQDGAVAKPVESAAATPQAVPEPEPEPEPPPPPKPLTPQQAKTKFLEVLAEYGSISKAAKAAGMTRAKVHRWLEEDEVFSFAYHQSLVAATEGLEEVARDRATRGARIERQVWRAGRLIETIIEYRPSDTALITLLKAQKPDVYRERIDQSVSGEVSVRYTNDWRSAPSVPRPESAAVPV